MEPRIDGTEEGGSEPDCALGRSSVPWERPEAPRGQNGTDVTAPVTFTTFTITAPPHHPPQSRGRRRLRERFDGYARRVSVVTSWISSRSSTGGGVGGEGEGGKEGGECAKSVFRRLWRCVCMWCVFGAFNVHYFAVVSSFFFFFFRCVTTTFAGTSDCLCNLLFASRGACTLLAILIQQ